MSTQIIERMAVEVDGQGEALVMVHGLGGTSNTFWPLMELLAPRFRVVRPDLPGSGRSPVPGLLSIQALTDRIAAATRALGIDRAHFAGHSLGTIVCLHLAAAQPSLVRSLALFGPLLAPSDTARPGLRERAAAVRRDGMQPSADAIVTASLSAESRTNRPVAAALVREMLMRQDPEGYARTCEALVGATAADVSAVRCPTLLITGDEDPVAPPATVRAMAERIPGARTVVLSRCGHWATLERPPEVTAALRDFYFGAGRRAAADRHQGRDMPAPR
jgi:pimeloyl-ACP methyl ester carboxylesterase